MDPDLLLNYLSDKDLLSKLDADRVLRHSCTLKGTLENTLVDNGLVEEETLLKAMSEVYGLPFLELEPGNLDVELATKLPGKLMETLCFYPLRREPGSDTIPLAMADPFDVNTMDTFRYITGYKVEPVLARRAQIQNAIKGRLLGEEGLQMIAERVPWDYALESLQEAPLTELESENSTPIIQLVSSILTSAFHLGASDIHFEPHEDLVRVRFRIDGILREIVRLPKRVCRACVARMKIISELDISESRKPQDGRTQLRLPEGDVDLRVSVLPTVWGEKVVMRLLDRTGEPPSLTQLGMLEEDLQEFKSFLRASHGMILLTGPTGSGKSSTLYAALRVLNVPGVNISTVEDPVEYQIKGVNQVPVNRKAGLTFAAALRSFLRQDPDIIMVGEIRDLETARIAVQAAQTGHLVFSTLHTNDSPSTLERLVMMGLEPHVVSGSLLCVVAQRLVRRLCPLCREESILTEEQESLLSLSYEAPQPAKVWKPVGCDECDGTGYRGRLGLFEILPITARLKQQILEDPSEELLWQTARREGLKTLLDDGIAKVERGLTSVDEVLRVVTLKRRSAATDHPEAESPEEPSVRDFPAALSPEPARWLPCLRVVDVMTPNVYTINARERVEDAVQKMLDWGVTGTVVVDETGKPVGVLSLNDIAAFMAVESRGDGSTEVNDIMSPWVIKVDPYTPLRRAFVLFQRHKVHRLVVMQGKKLLGILTPLDLVTRSYQSPAEFGFN